MLFSQEFRFVTKVVEQNCAPSLKILWIYFAVSFYFSPLGSLWIWDCGISPHSFAHPYLPTAAPRRWFYSKKHYRKLWKSYVQGMWLRSDVCYSLMSLSASASASFTPLSSASFTTLSSASLCISNIFQIYTRINGLNLKKWDDV